MVDPFWYDRNSVWYDRHSFHCSVRVNERVTKPWLKHFMLTLSNQSDLCKLLLTCIKY